MKKDDNNDISYETGVDIHNFETSCNSCNAVVEKDVFDDDDDFDINNIVLESIINKSCFQCGSTNVEHVLGCWGWVNELGYHGEQLIYCSGEILAEYGSMYGYQPVIEHKLENKKGNLIREIESYYAGTLIREEYDNKGNLINFYSHPLYKKFIKNNLLTFPKVKEKKIIIYKNIEIEYEDKNDDENNLRFVLDREAEWISDINRKDLYIHSCKSYDGVTEDTKRKRLKTLSSYDAEYSDYKRSWGLPGYDWGNCFSEYCGFIHEHWEGTKILKERYYVWNGVITNHPKLIYDKKGCLEEVTVQLDNTKHLLWDRN
jgi:hypothetical protein